MKDFLLQLKNQVVELWQRLTSVQKIIIGVSAAVLFVTLIFLTRGATAPDYGPLFTMEAQEAGQVKAQLDEKNIPYQLVNNPDGGVTVMVPSKDILNTRLDLAVEGLPTGGVIGYESLDATKFGETDTDRRARNLRALQGELTRTIEGMPEIEKARVFIVQPEHSVFIEENKNATASLMLSLKPNSTLKPGQVDGIIKLVANSVEGLKPENVTIIDMFGNVLSDSVRTGKEESANLSLTQSEHQKQYQKEVQESVQSMLEAVVGMGNAVVRVKLDLDFDKIQRIVKDFGETSPRSTSKSERTTESNTGGGIPGTDSNVPGYETINQTGSSTSSETEVITNNEVDSLEEIIEQAPGSIKRMSVAVVVDKELNTKDQQTIEEIVKGAAGFNGDRGDQISVAGIPFNTEYRDEMTRLIAEADKMEMYIYAGIAAAAALVFIVGVLIIFRRKRSQEEEFPSEFAVPAFFDEESEEAIEAKKLSPEEKEMKRIKTKVEQVAKEQTEDFAQLIKTWLAQE